MLRGQALTRLGRTTEGDRELKSASQLPDDPAWDDPYVREVERLRVGSAAILAQAGRMVSEGQATEAIPLLERLVQQMPEAVEPRLVLGQAYQLAGDSRASQKTLLELIHAHPDSVDGWFQLGVAQFTLGDADGAAKSFATVVRLKPDHANAYFNLAHALRKKGDRAGLSPPWKRPCTAGRITSHLASYSKKSGPRNKCSSTRLCICTEAMGEF